MIKDIRIRRRDAVGKVPRIIKSQRHRASLPVLRGSRGQLCFMHRALSRYLRLLEWRYLLRTISRVAAFLLVGPRRRRSSDHQALITYTVLAEILSGASALRHNVNLKQLFQPLFWRDWKQEWRSEIPRDARCDAIRREGAHSRQKSTYRISRVGEVAREKGRTARRARRWRQRWVRKQKMFM